MNEVCALCGGPHQFATVIPNHAWEEVVREAKLPEFLCLNCLVIAFAAAGRGFTAVLELGTDRIPIEMVVRGHTAMDAHRLVGQNEALTVRLRDLRALLRVCLEKIGEGKLADDVRKELSTRM